MENNNPFARPLHGAPAQSPSPAEGNALSDAYHGLLHHFAQFQHRFHALLSDAFTALDGGSAAATATILGIALVYGIVHAAGPGHGKAVVSLYCIANGEKSRKAFELGFLIAAVHTLSALLLTTGIYFFMETLFSRTFGEVSSVMQRISGGAIAAVGIYLLAERFLFRHGEKDGRRLLHRFQNRRFAPLLVALSVGAVPCPGVMTMLLFALTLQHYAVGVAAAAVMSLGMGLTISVAGALSAGAGGGARRLSPRLEGVLHGTGAAAIILLGFFLVAAA